MTGKARAFLLVASLALVAGCQTVPGTRIGGGAAVEAARAYMGTNPTDQHSLWCADFTNLVEQELGRSGTGSRRARSFLDYGSDVPVDRAQRGDIVVLSRGRRGGHVGYFIRWEDELLVLVSGNVGGRVGESGYSRRRVLGIRRPPGSTAYDGGED